jgi:hypothetical protein
LAIKTSTIRGRSPLNYFDQNFLIIHILKTAPLRLIMGIEITFEEVGDRGGIDERSNTESVPAAGI